MSILTNILGVYYGHNASVCLLKDGRVADFVSEERFTGIKNQPGLPKKSIDYILKKNKLTASDIDAVAVPVTTNAPIYASRDSQKNAVIKSLRFLYDKIPILKNTFGLVSFYHPYLRPLGKFFYFVFAATVGKYTAYLERKKLASYMKIPVSKIKAYDHHASHAFSAYYANPYNTQKCLVLTLDAEGDGICASVNVFNKNSFKRLAAIKPDNSLGLMYAAVTQYLGMKVGEHEYKVMGLAPYAKQYNVDHYYKRVKNLFTLTGDNKLQIHCAFDSRQTLVFLRREMSDVRFDVLAAVFQKVLEDTVVKWVSQAIRVTGINTLCVAGGVFMNVKMNQKIAGLSGVKKFFIMPSCSDESSPLGAAYISYIERMKTQGKKINIAPIGPLYWGPEYSNGEVLSFLKSVSAAKKYKIQYVKNIEKKIALLLSQNKVVGRMKGRMEWGARALGNRSILANPKNQDIVMVINEQMKDRDFFMPFTPSVLEERAARYIINPKKIFAPYMIITFNSTKRASQDLRAALHPYDFTARVQMVRRDWNPSYYSLIEEFEKLTGIGGILNTSFNLHGLPIVMGPKEAYFAFEHCGLEYLAMENYLVSKKIK